MRDVLFYRTDTGGDPIGEFLDSLNPKQAAKVTWVLSLIEEMERVPAQYLKKLAGTDDIWEIRAQEGREVYRLLGFFDGPKFIELAENRKRDYLSRKNDE